MPDETYTFVDQRMARQALELAKPTIVALLATMAKRQDLHVVIGLIGVNGEGAILVQESFGDFGAWEHDYEPIAKGKFYLSARTGLPSRLVQADHPFLLGVESVVHGGSVVEDEVVVACSGVESYFDEAVAGVILAILKGLCHHELARQRALNIDFFHRR